VGWRNVIVVGAVCALAIGAAVDALRGTTDGAVAVDQSVTSRLRDDRLRGPDVPPPGALPGTLVFADQDGCRLRRLSLTTSILGSPGPATGCELWVSPAGGLAVVTTEPAAPGGSRRLALAGVGAEPRLVRDLGEATGIPAWSANGKRVAWCEAESETVVEEIATGAREHVAGCSPLFGGEGDGSLFTVPPRALGTRLLRDGQTYLGPAALRSGLDAASDTPVWVVGLGASSDGQLAISLLVLAPTGSDVVLELWRGQTLEASFALPKVFATDNRRLGEFLRFSPDGHELAVGFGPGAGRLSFVDLRLREGSVSTVSQTGFAWSPDGSWLAVATGGTIEIYGQVRDTPVFTLPVAAAGLGWTSPGGG